MGRRRNITIRDRNFTALRRHGSGSFTTPALVLTVTAEYKKQGRRPPKRLQHYTQDLLHHLAEAKLLERRQGQPNRFKPTPPLIELSRRARRALPEDAHPKEVGDFYNAGTGNLKVVPKREVWHRYLTAEERNDLLERENAALRAGIEQVPTEGLVAAQEAHASSDAPELMEVDDGNPFLEPQGPSDAGAGPSCPPQTPLRGQPSQSYPSPPSTALPPVRQGSVASDPDATAIDISQHNLPEQAVPIAPLMAMVNEAQSANLPVQGDVYDQIFSRTAQDVRLQIQRERRAWQQQLDQAGASTANGTTSPDPALSAVRRENELLTGERDFYQKKHFATAVALRSSQLQVEKRDTEAAGLVGTIARTLGLSRWMP